MAEQLTASHHAQVATRLLSEPLSVLDYRVWQYLREHDMYCNSVNTNIRISSLFFHGRGLRGGRGLEGGDSGEGGIWKIYEYVDYRLVLEYCTHVDRCWQWSLMQWFKLPTLQLFSCHRCRGVLSHPLDLWLLITVHNYKTMSVQKASTESAILYQNCPELSVKIGDGRASTTLAAIHFVFVYKFGAGRYFYCYCTIVTQGR